MDKNKFVMRWIRFTFLASILAFIGSIFQDGDLPMALIHFIGIIFASAIIYCAMFLFIALLFWTWNGNEYIKKNLPSEDVINP